MYPFMFQNCHFHKKWLQIHATRSLLFHTGILQKGDGGFFQFGDPSLPRLVSVTMGDGRKRSPR